jgi:hypothetical protein
MLELSRRLSLAILGELIGGMNHAAIGQSIGRCSKRRKRDPALKCEASRSEKQLSNVSE